MQIFHKSKELYLSFASEVFEYNNKNELNISEEKLIHNYFPLLTNENVTNFDSLEKNSIDLYASFKSLYLQNRENKIANSIKSEDEWGNLDD